MPTDWTVDLETCSELDLSVCGAQAYARHPTTETLALSAVCWQTKEKARWTPGLRPWVPPLGARLWGWNAVNFDRLIWQFVLAVRDGFPPAEAYEWRDLMFSAAYGALPLKLEKAAKVIAEETGLNTPQKDMDGHKLMLRLCKPARPILGDADKWRLHVPADLERLATYCDQDVEAETYLTKHLPTLPRCLDRVVAQDRKINDRGVAVDLAFVRAMKDMRDRMRLALRQDLSQLTAGMVESETKRGAFAEWLTVQGIPVPEGKGATDKQAVLAYREMAWHRPDSPSRDRLLSVLRIWSELGKTSLAKLEALEAATCSDGRLRSIFQFYGASATGRWAGRILGQNMPKGNILGMGGPKLYELARGLVREGDISTLRLLYGSDSMDVLAALIRTCFVAGRGKVLLVCDWNAIEARVAFWLCEDEEGLAIYSDPKRDLYNETGEGIYERKIDRKGKDKLEGEVSKMTALGSQYGLGPTRHNAQAHQAGLMIPMTLSEAAIAAYRAKFRGVPQGWSSLEMKAKEACNAGGRHVHWRRGVSFQKADDGCLYIWLPSGRHLTYRNAKVELRPGKFGPRPALCYSYEHQQTHQWVHDQTWGGPILENIDQGHSACLLGDALCKAEDAGLPPVMHFHDEIVAEVDESKADHKKLEAVMCDLAPWSTGLPIKAEGWTGSYWRK